MLGEIIDKFTNKFTETVFVKTDSELEKQIEALEILLKKYPNSEFLKSKLKICKIGLQGEKEIEFELKNANIGMFVIHDLNIEYGDIKAQVDYLIVTPAYNYFVECKNLLGSITVDQNGNFSRDYYIDNRRIKEGMYSPLAQAQRHIEVFKKIWAERNNSLLDKLLRKDKLDIWNRPLVVMANSKNILNLRFAPKDYKKKIIKSDSLVQYLKKDIENCDSDCLFNKKQMQTCIECFMEGYHKPVYEDYIDKFEKEMLVQAKYSKKQVEKKTTTNSGVKEKLLDFRKEKSTKRNIPAYYIFTNDELEAILNLMPKTIEELKESKILSDTKVQYHGKEIIDIIKNKSSHQN